MIAALLAELSSLGITLTVVDGQLHARPRRLLTPEIRELIAEHKPAIVATLSGPSLHSPLDDDILVHFARKHTTPEIDRRIERLTQRTARPDATPLDVVLLDDWRRIREGQRKGSG